MQLVEMHAFAIVCYLFTYRIYFTSSKSTHYISLSDLRERVANIAETQK